MKKISLILIISFFFTSNFFAEDISVKSVKGKVKYEESSGKWIEVKKGDTLDTTKNINTGLNSSVVLALNGSNFSIKEIQNGKIEDLIKKTTRDNVKDFSTENSKVTSTLSTRADDKDEDDWAN